MDDYQAIMSKKLGLSKYNKELISKLLNNMAVDKVDYTNFFRLLSSLKANPNTPENELLKPLKAVLLDIGKERKEAWIKWVRSYIQEVSNYFLTIFSEDSVFDSVLLLAFLTSNDTYLKVTITVFIPASSWLMQLLIYACGFGNCRWVVVRYQMKKEKQEWIQ